MIVRKDSPPSGIGHCNIRGRALKIDSVCFYISNLELSTDYWKDDSLPIYIYANVIAKRGMFCKC
jgi:hypothetical protein